MREADLYKLRAQIGMVFQESALFDSIDVEDNVAYRLNEEHVPEDEAHNRVVEALKFVELEQAIDKFPSGVVRRDAAAGVDCAGDYLGAGPDSVRLAYGRAGPDYVDHDHRAGDEAARRLAHHVAAGDAPAAGRFYAGDSSLRSREGDGGASQRRSEPRDRREHQVPDAE